MVMPMSERDTDFPASAEDSAYADTSRNTAEFRAFASRSGGEAESPWNMRAPKRKVALLAGVIIVVAVVLVIVAIAVLNA
jgi:hypothetical protein